MGKLTNKQTYNIHGLKHRYIQILEKAEKGKPIRKSKYSETESAPLAGFPWLPPAAHTAGAEKVRVPALWRQAGRMSQS